MTEPSAAVPSAVTELPNYVDSSMLTTFRSCRRKFYWSYVEALSPTGKSVHLIAGAAFAAGVEAARKEAFKNPEGGIEAQLNAAFPVFLREWGDFEAPENSAKTFERTFDALTQYLTEFNPLTDYVQPLHLDPPSVEYTFAIPIEGVLHPTTKEPFLFVGRFDMLAKYSAAGSGSEGLPCVVDEKTTSTLPYNWTDQWGMRGQFIGYCWAMQQLGIPVNTAVIRGIAIQKTQIQFRTAIVQFPQHLIDRWHQQLISDLQRIASTYQIEQDWQEKAPGLHNSLWELNFGDTCSSYGGCPFLGLCQAKDAEPFFNNYVRHRWNPLAKQPLEAA